MKRMKMRIQLSVLVVIVLAAGCGQKEAQRGNDGGVVTTGRVDIIQPGDEMPEHSPEESMQEGSTPAGNIPAESGQPSDGLAQAEESPENPFENDPVGNPSSQTEKADRSLLPGSRIRHVYGGILSMLAAAYELPDMEIDKEFLYDGTYEISDNCFAVADVDGDGVIYEIDTDPDRSGEPVWYDGDDFDEWILQKMEGASEIQISYEPVVVDRFRNFSTDHLTLLHDIAQEDAGVSQTDIGLLYIQQGSLSNVKAYLSDHYAAEWKTNPEEFTGSVDGNEVFSLIFMDGGILSYSGSRVEDITIFGIYPGMDADMAVMTLMSYGFYPKDNLENNMITGDGVGNAAVSYEIANGVIIDISVSMYCSYAG